MKNERADSPMSDDNPNPEHPAGLPATPSEAPPQKPYRVRHDGWTVERQNKFIDVLGRTGCVRDAARMAGISWNSAYKFRQRDADFAERWERALRRAKTPLGEVAWKRAVEGEKQDIWYHGKVVGTRKKYANDMLRLLYQHDTNGAGRDAQGRFAPADTVPGTVPETVPGTLAAAEPEPKALPAPQDEGPIARPKGPVTMDNLSTKLAAMTARAHEYGQRHINIKTGKGMTDEVVEAVQRFVARDRVELPKEFQWTSADDYDAKEAQFLAQHRGGSIIIDQDG